MLIIHLFFFTLRGNLISSQRALKALVSVEKSLRVLVILDNPLAKMDDYRLYVISHLSQLERLDKDPITADEKSEAQEKLKVCVLCVTYSVNYCM